jgi:PAS domain S-box-containing protein
MRSSVHFLSQKEPDSEMTPESPTLVQKLASAITDKVRARWFLRLAFFTTAYFLCQQIAFMVPETKDLVAAVWPAAGVALAALLLSPRRDWPLLLALFFLAGLGANLTTNRPWFARTGFMVANICETTGAAFLITRWCGTNTRFQRMKDMLSLIAAATLLNGATAFIGAGTAALTSRADFWLFYRTWWIADGLGLLLLTPAIVVWATEWRILLAPRQRRLGERILLLVVSVALGALVFHPGLIDLPVQIEPYFLFATVLWSATRFGPLATSTLVMLLAPLAIGLESMGLGKSPWGISDPASRVLSMQLFFGILATVGMVLASGLAEQRHAQDKLRASEAALKRSQQWAHLGHWTWDVPTNRVSWSDEMFAIFGVERKGFNGDLNAVIARAIFPDDREKVRASNERVISDGQPAQLEYRVVWPDGTVRHVLAQPSERILDNQGAIVRLSGIVQDITERHLAGEALRDSEFRYHDLFGQMMEGFALCEMRFENGKAVDFRYLQVNDAFGKLTGLTDVVGKWVSQVIPGIRETNPGLLETYGRVAATGQPERFEEYVPPLGIWFQVAVHCPRQGQFVAMFDNITARKKAEAALLTSLREKEALLTEVHHRVKNNLQVISSLLRLEADRLQGPVAEAVLGDLQGRVRAMALLHENLYRSGNLAEVDVPTYLRSLCQQAFRAGFNQRIGSVDVKVDVAPLQLDIGQAISCGLLVNELVTNSLKHAFPSESGGKVEVALSPEHDSELWRLVVSDNGVGLPDDFGSGQGRRSLGMQLIADLGRQLQGSIQWSSEVGTRCTLTFAPRKGDQEAAHG